jgi:hypothetical protein
MAFKTVLGQSPLCNKFKKLILFLGGVVWCTKRNDDQRGRRGVRIAQRAEVVRVSLYENPGITHT